MGRIMQDRHVYSNETFFVDVLPTWRDVARIEMPGADVIVGNMPIIGNVVAAVCAMTGNVTVVERPARSSLSAV